MPQPEGVEVKLGRATFVVPPISVWAQEQLETPGADADARSQVNRLFSQLLMLLEPNYPDLTVADLKKAVPLRDLQGCVGRVVKAASDGIEMSAPGEAKGP